MTVTTTAMITSDVFRIAGRTDSSPALLSIILSSPRQTGGRFEEEGAGFRRQEIRIGSRKGISAMRSRRAYLPAATEGHFQEIRQDLIRSPVNPLRGNPRT